MKNVAQAVLPASVDDFIHLECSGCGKAMKARREQAGKTVQCPSCGQRGRLPKYGDESDDSPNADAKPVGNSAIPVDPDASAKSKPMSDVEKSIRDEIRSYRVNAVEIFKWGTTLLVSFETALFFIRESVAKDLGVKSTLQLPPDRWFAGTLFVFVVALCCFTVSWLVGTSLRSHMAELKKLPDLAGPIVKPSRWGRYILVVIFFVFPLFDALVYLVLRGWD
jgi:hypothetical protein